MTNGNAPPPGESKQARISSSSAKRIWITPNWVNSALEAQSRERIKLVRELATVRGLMPLLMKPRNGNRWSMAERAELQQRLRALAHASPYLLAMVLPGSFVALPALAWWLDRRRQNRAA